MVPFLVSRLVQRGTHGRWPPWMRHLQKPIRAESLVKGALGSSGFGCRPVWDTVTAPAWMLVDTGRGVGWFWLCLLLSGSLLASSEYQ